VNAPAQAGLPAFPLKDPKLFREQCFVDGEWLDASSKKFIEVKIPPARPCWDVCPTWVPSRRAARSRRPSAPGRHGARKTGKERAALLRKWFELMMASQEDLAQILTAEQGKPAVETRRAIEAAERAWPAWRAKTGKERAALLRKWFELMMASQEDLAQILTAEQGKPLAEARGEIAYGASFIEWFGEEAKRVYGDTIPRPGATSASWC